MKWICCSKELPEKMASVLVAFKNNYGNTGISIGQYVPPKTVLSEDFLTDDVDCSSLEEYDEEKDCYWVKEGWFEHSTQYDYGCSFHEKITHWMSLPKPPELLENKLMNREIKFRVWDKKIKEFHYWDSVNQAYDNIFWKMVKDEDMPLMQYTGLKDKNGKEIYEGDIVDGHNDGFGIVVWGSSGWDYEFSDKNIVSMDEVCTWFGNNATIIGNIHENPELLEGEE